MPDLNELLRWSIENSAPRDGDAPAASAPAPAAEQPLSLSFRPTSDPAAASSALHPSDPHFPLANNGPTALAPSEDVAGAAGTPAAPARRDDLTTEMLDLIMGKSDSVVMKEKMALAVDESQDVADRVDALDDFEMLVELIDNANNMAVLKLWEPLLGLLGSEHNEVVTHAAWIIGTAVQNNIKAQAALYVHGALPKILSLIYPAASASGPPHPTSTRGKATYAFSASVKHWPLASSALSANSSQGYSVLRRGVSDPQPVIRRKMAFLVGTLVMQSNETYTGELPDDVRQLIEERTQTQHDTQTLIAGLEKEGVFNALVEALRTSDGDIEFEENAIRTLSQAAKQGALSDEEKKASKGIWATWGAEGQSERGLGGEDGKVVEQSLA